MEKTTDCVLCKKSGDMLASPRCPDCGRALCPDCAKKSGGLCPNCFVDLEYWN